MKTLVLTASLLVFLHCIYAAPVLSGEDENLFKTWMSEFNKTYSSQDEYYYRLRVFTENKRMIDRHNAGNHSYTMGLNQFADMTSDEFKKKGCVLREPRESTGSTRD